MLIFVTYCLRQLRRPIPSLQGLPEWTATLVHDQNAPLLCGAINFKGRVSKPGLFFVAGRFPPFFVDQNTHSGHSSTLSFVPRKTF